MLPRVAHSEEGTGRFPGVSSRPACAARVTAAGSESSLRLRGRARAGTEDAGGRQEPRVTQASGSRLPAPVGSGRARRLGVRPVPLPRLRVTSAAPPPLQAAAFRPGCPEGPDSTPLRRSAPASSLRRPRPGCGRENGRTQREPRNGDRPGRVRSGEKAARRPRGSSAATRTRSVPGPAFATCSVPGVRGGSRPWRRVFRPFGLSSRAGVGLPHRRLRPRPAEHRTATRGPAHWPRRVGRRRRFTPARLRVAFALRTPRHGPGGACRRSPGSGLREPRAPAPGMTAGRAAAGPQRAQEAQLLPRPRRGWRPQELAGSLPAACGLVLLLPSFSGGRGSSPLPGGPLQRLDSDSHLGATRRRAAPVTVPSASLFVSFWVTSDLSRGAVAAPAG